MKHGNPSVMSKVVEAGMGRKWLALWAGEQQDRRVCSQARGPPSGCAEPSQSHWILRLEEFCILRGRNSLRKDSLSV